MTMRSRQSGFTLIELLVVIAIIAILASILFPVYASAKERARQVKCLSNLRQLATAIRLYADDNDGRLPSAGIYMGTADWAGGTSVGGHVFPEKGTIWNYTKKSRWIFSCQTDYKVPPLNINPPQNPFYPLSYTMNYSCDIARLDGLPIRISRMLLLIHEHRNAINDSLFYWGVSQNTYDIPSNVHYDGTTVVYADGHARWANAKVLCQERNENWWSTGLTPRK
ncbi:MAG TPA: prepilin-type N-terminal cleavage/methylation domain-containing protein [Armatimonadota bacterium]|nr:prepilin-type N-terminal cleavage/methylation domain-containing protein [Armatimonadota bacterium]